MYYYLKVQHWNNCSLVQECYPCKQFKAIDNSDSSKNIIAKLLHNFLPMIQLQQKRKRSFSYCNGFRWCSNKDAISICDTLAQMYEFKFSSSMNNSWRNQKYLNFEHYSFGQPWFTDQLSSTSFTHLVPSTSQLPPALGNHVPPRL